MRIMRTGGRGGSGSGLGGFDEEVVNGDPEHRGDEPEDDAGDGVAGAVGFGVLSGRHEPHDPEDERQWAEDEPEDRDQAEDPTVVCSQGCPVPVRDQLGDAVVAPPTRPAPAIWGEVVVIVVRIVPVPRAGIVAVLGAHQNNAWIAWTL